MKLRTIFLAPGRVAPGMTLAEPVLDKAGHRLLSSGTILDTVTLDHLSRRGVEAIAVLLPDTRDEETIAKEISAAESRVADIFRGSGSAARDALQSAVLQFRRDSTR